MADVLALCSDELAGRGSYQPGGVRAAAFMEAALAQAGLEIVRQPISRGAETVIGIKRGGARAVLVSAHYDHLGIDETGTVFLGADDNASGAAILLGMARASRTARYQHTVLFVAFGAEEDGLAGSGVYVADPVWPLHDTIAIINFDMVGRNFFETGANQSDTAAVIGLDEIDGAGEATRAAAADAGLKLVAAPARVLELFGFDDRTDDWWFRRQRVPAVHFSTGLHEDYHRPTDTPDRVVKSQMERIARTANGLLRFLAE
jgi:Zn-dependent M28 family amino/carboxypeptidase